MTETALQDAQALAEATSKSMYDADACTRWLGMRIEAVGPGYARLTMTVRPEFLNGHRTCHGGLIFTLADSAFAFACNSHNHNTVAAGCSVEFLHPAHGGDVLTAEATEQVLSGRHGVYDVHISNQSGEVVAMFRGKSAQIRGHVIPVPDSTE
ncbi:hydroxyphenylacetyl-CoA thioesterase PaaI [Ralstonia pickettii]|nr:phenylacetic acid degradation protein [Ralstonia sp. MD27]MBA9857981.1 hydroxyphenylacetyl-CoA thioesterase PaaI [Ralstonia insidiosa]MBX3774146.1 hydroxyphenylacetyl-CoA thioesterase PaaI [Ralstonia pickettii]NOZ15026.1 hydroxyphenylacetyl-CoA thioesterase PaaI [Betaproteobacteria bacterium]MBA9871717.1 hydroxyphenylacetyl-CoA thioesterase PaaI [Ralstonia insidiosa]